MGGGDRAWCTVIESFLLCSSDKGFWACLGDLPSDMDIQPETWVSSGNLIRKLCGILHSSAILESDSPWSNNSNHNHPKVKSGLISSRKRSNNWVWLTSRDFLSGG